MREQGTGEERRYSVDELVEVARAAAKDTADHAMHVALGDRDGDGTCNSALFQC